MTDCTDYDALWDAVATQFSKQRRRSLFAIIFNVGFSSRTGHKRIQKLTYSAHAQGLQTTLRNRPLMDLRYLSEISVVNLEQAMAAFRLNIVLNVTIMVGSIVLINQIFPNAIASLLDQMLNDPTLGRWVLVAIFVTLVFSTVFIPIYSWLAVSEARDLKHVLDIELAKRQANKTSAISLDTDPADVTSDLRNNLLSDF